MSSGCRPRLRTLGTSRLELKQRVRLPMRIAVIAGDGIGKDVTGEAVKVLGGMRRLRRRPRARAAAVGRGSLPGDRRDDAGRRLPLLRDDFDAIFVGALGDPRVADNRHARDILLGTRFELDLYVNYRPVRLLDERLCPLKDRGPADVNFVVFRENTEGVYVGIGGRFKAGTDGRDRDPGRDQHLQGRAPHHPARVRVRAERAGCTEVCMADKSNAMQQGHALWQRVFKEVAARVSRASRPRICTSTRWRCSWSRTPAQFEVIVTNNLFGDIVTDIGARAAGRARDGGLGQHPSGPHVDVRAGARLGAAAGREERRQPDRRDSLGGADARDARPRGRSRGGRARPSRPRSCTQARPRRTSAARSARARSATAIAKAIRTVNFEQLEL